MRSCTRIRTGKAPGLDHAGGCHDAQRLHEVVDVGVQAGVVAARAGGEPAAESRELEGLGEVAQCVAVGAQLVLQHRPARPGLDAGCTRDRVDLDDAVQARQVDRHRPRIVVADVALDAADHRGASAVRDGSGVGVGAPVEEVDDL